MGIAKSGELFDSPDFLHVSIFLLQLCIVSYMMSGIFDPNTIYYTQFSGQKQGRKLF